MSARRWIPWLTFLVVLICTLAVAAAIYRVDQKHREADFAFAAAQEMNRLATFVHMQFRPVQHVATTFSIAAGELDARKFDNLVNSIPLADAYANDVAGHWLAQRARLTEGVGHAIGIAEAQTAARTG